MTAFERHARNVALLTSLSRVTGLVRDAALSRIFGAGLVADAFFFAFMIPNLFRRLFGEGALAAAFLPVFSRLDREEPARARALATLIISTMIIALGGLTLLGEIVLFFLSARVNHQNLALWLTMIMLPYMPMVCIVAILGAMLQVRGRFGPTAASPIVLNGCLIAAAVGLAIGLDTGVYDDVIEKQRLIHIGGVTASVLVAGVLQVLWSLWALRGEQWWIRRRESPELHVAAREPARRVFRAALPMILGLGVLQVNTLIDGIIASYPTAVGDTIFGVKYPLEEGAMAAISFAQRLYQFPLGVFGIAVATAIFPALARVSEDDRAFVDIVRRGLRLVVFIGLPASVGLMLVRSPLTAVILEGGDFDAEDTARVSHVLLGYAPAVWAYSMMHVLTRAFYARDDSTTPVKVAVAMVALNFALNCTLIWTPLKEAGLAWSTAICATLQAIILLGLLSRRVGRTLDAAVVHSWAKSAGAAALMAICVISVALYVPSSAEASWSQSLWSLLALVFMGGLVYVLAALALRMRELRWSLGRG